MFNINSNGDVKIYYASGENEVFRRVTDIAVDYTDKGVRYQLMGVLDDEGNELLLQLLDDGGMNLMYPIAGLILVFTNIDEL